MHHEEFPGEDPIETRAAGGSAAPKPATGSHRQNELTTLALRLTQGDPTAMDAFYDLTCKVTYGLAYRLLGHSRGTEALLRDAYVDAWRTIRINQPAPGLEIRWVLSLVLRRYDQTSLDTRPSIPANRRSGPYTVST